MADLYCRAASEEGGLRIADYPDVSCPANGPCLLEFQLDGNLVSSFNGKVLWDTDTEGRGMWFVCQEFAPWLWIADGESLCDC